MAGKAMPGHGQVRVLFGGDRHASLAYATAHFGKSLFWQAGELLLAFFLTEAAGLAPTAMGGVIALSLLASAASDLLVGHALRRTLSSVRGAALLQLQGAALAALALVCLFTTAHLPPELRLPFALGMALLFRVGYSVYDTPQNVLLSLATTDSVGRARGAATRIAVSGGAGLGLALAVAPLLVDDGVPSQATRFLLLTVLMAVVAMGSACWLWRVLRHAGEGAAPRLPGSPGAEANPPWPLLGLFFILLVSVPLFGKLEPYFAVHVLRSPGWGGALVTASALATIVSQPLWRRVITGRGRTGLVIAFSTLLLACAGLWLLTAYQPWMALCCAMLLGMAGGGLGLTLWSAYADAAATLPGARIGLAYAALTATSKLALAMGALLLGALLGGFDYRQADNERIIWLMAAGPAIGAVGCIVFALLWHHFSVTRMETMHAKTS